MFKMIFTFMPFVFLALTVLLFVVPSRLKTRAQAIWTMILLLSASKFLCFETFGGDAFAPELPDKVIWFWNWAYSGMCALLALAILAWPVRLAVSRRVPFERWRTVWLVALPVLAWTVSAVGVYNGFKPPELKEVTVEFADLPDSLDGYRIVHITDIHASSASRRWRTEEIVRIANAAKGDMICVTGDLSDGYSRRRKKDLEPIKDLEAPDGVYFVTGNHEYFFDAPNWRGEFARWNLRFLANSCAFPRPSLAVAGVSDPACSRMYEPMPDPARVFDGATNGEFRVLLQHRPRPDYSKIYGEGYSYSSDLQLSGHTHGGVMPGLSFIVKRANDGLVKGLYRNGDGSVVYVSPGAGQWAGFPVRLFNDGEVTVITLRKK